MYNSKIIYRNYIAFVLLLFVIASLLLGYFNEGEEAIDGVNNVAEKQVFYKEFTVFPKDWSTYLFTNLTITFSTLFDAKYNISIYPRRTALTEEGYNSFKDGAFIGNDAFIFVTSYTLVCVNLTTRQLICSSGIESGYTETILNIVVADEYLYVPIIYSESGSYKKSLIIYAYKIEHLLHPTEKYYISPEKLVIKEFYTEDQLFSTSIAVHNEEIVVAYTGENINETYFLTNRTGSWEEYAIETINSLAISIYWNGSMYVIGLANGSWPSLEVWYMATNDFQNFPINRRIVENLEYLYYPNTLKIVYADGKGQIFLYSGSPYFFVADEVSEYNITLDENVFGRFFLGGTCIKSPFENYTYVISSESSGIFNNLIYIRANDSCVRRFLGTSKGLHDVIISWDGTSEYGGGIPEFTYRAIIKTNISDDVFSSDFARYLSPPDAEMIYQNKYFSDKIVFNVTSSRETFTHVFLYANDSYSFTGYLSRKYSWFSIKGTKYGEIYLVGRTSENELFLQKGVAFGTSWVYSYHIDSNVLYFDFDIDPTGTLIVICYLQVQNKLKVKYSYDRGNSWIAFDKDLPASISWDIRDVKILGYNSIELLIENSSTYENTLNVITFRLFPFEEVSQHLIMYSESYYGGCIFDDEILFIYNETHIYVHNATSNETVLLFSSNNPDQYIYYGVAVSGNSTDEVLDIYVLYIRGLIEGYEVDRKSALNKAAYRNIYSEETLSATDAIVYEDYVFLTDTYMEYYVESKIIYAINEQWKTASRQVKIERTALYGNYIDDGTYLVKVCCLDSSGLVSETESWLVFDEEPPEIHYMNIIGDVVGWSRDVIIEIETNEKLLRAVIRYSYGKDWCEMNMTFDGERYTATLTRDATHAKILYYIILEDFAHNVVVYDNDGLYYTIEYVPEMPSFNIGPEEGIILAIISGTIGGIVLAFYIWLTKKQTREPNIKILTVIYIVLFGMSMAFVTMLTISVGIHDYNVMLGALGLGLLFLILLLIVWCNRHLIKVFQEKRLDKLGIIITFVHVAGIILFVSSILVIGEYVEWFKYYILRDYYNIYGVQIPKMYLNVFGIIATSLVLVIVSIYRNIRLRLKEYKLISMLPVSKEYIGEMKLKAISSLSGQIGFRSTIFVALFGVTLLSTTRLSSFINLGIYGVAPFILVILIGLSIYKLVTTLRRKTKKITLTERTIRCSFCDKEIPANAHYCQYCGKAIPQKFVKYEGVVCPNCKNITPMGEYCIFCGSALSKTVAGEESKKEPTSYDEVSFDFDT